MMLFRKGQGSILWKTAAAGVALGLAACAPVDDSIGSRLAQPAKGSPPQQANDVGDIAIVGQEVAHAIVGLPAVANASVPPLVQFTGVTSIIDKPINTAPYTALLRDRLLLLTREKLRFVERTLPAYNGGKKKSSEFKPLNQNTSNPDFEILAELRGHAEDDYYKIQIEFVDMHSNEVLFNGLYRIKRESDYGGGGGDASAPEAYSTLGTSRPQEAQQAPQQKQQSAQPGYYDPPAKSSNNSGPANVY